MTKQAKAESFWGLVSAVIDLQRFYEDSGLFSDDLTINIAIRGRDATGHNGELFYGDESIFKAKPVIANVSLPSGSWHMAAVPKKRLDILLVECVGRFF
ncbi:hypothetical protein [Teredinibacter purpureus]|uniref:hypothetical protein n=1 Tax=Teredinibacter purpureus TaxID=2731756 RepID=UPI0013C4D86A|nr:hypothetical protein [Teredinibacter purpureus]